MFSAAYHTLISRRFGFDENDLPLENFCDKLREEIEYIIDRKLVADSASLKSVDSDEFIARDSGEQRKDL